MNNDKRICHICMCNDSTFHLESLEDVVAMLNKHQRKGVAEITIENTCIKFDE